MTEKESLRVKDLEHVLIEKVDRLFQDMLWELRRPVLSGPGRKLTMRAYNLDFYCCGYAKGTCQNRKIRSSSGPLRRQMQSWLYYFRRSMFGHVLIEKVEQL